MSKNRNNIMDTKALIAAVLPIATIALPRILSPVLHNKGYNPPGMEGCMLVSAGVQRTS